MLPCEPINNDKTRSNICKPETERTVRIFEPTPVWGHAPTGVLSETVAPDSLQTHTAARSTRLLLYILNFSICQGERVGEHEYKEYSATAVVRWLERGFKNVFFTAALLELAHRSQEMPRISRKQEISVGGVAMAAGASAMTSRLFLRRGGG